LEYCYGKVKEAWSFVISPLKKKTPLGFWTLVMGKKPPRVWDLGDGKKTPRVWDLGDGQKKP
jgi:hypothetical protein